MKKTLHLFIFSILSYFFCNLLEASSRDNRTVLVVGGAGFLGSHLSERLLEENAYVTCLDNLHTGSLVNISHLLDHPRFSFVQHDIVQPFQTESEFSEIYNLASIASPDHYFEDPIQTMLTSVVGSYNLLEIAKKCNAKIFLASTSEVYGDPLVHPQKESYWGNVHSIGPRSCYDEGKRAAETLFFDYKRKEGVRIKVARIFNTYGPRMSLNDGRVVPAFIKQALENRPLHVHGTGSQTRSLCYVSDMINAIIALMNTSEDVTGPINLGNPHEQTILDLANTVVAQCESSSEIEFLPLREEDPQKRCPDIHKAKEILLWEPKVSLDEGLAKTISYFKHVLSEST